MIAPFLRSASERRDDPGCARIGPFSGRFASEARDPRNMHLQWFAAEEEGRTEEPTEYRIKKAREEGRVAKSQELTGSLGLLIPALALVALAPSVLATIMEMLSFFLRRSTEIDPVSEPGIIAQAFFNYFIRLTTPFLAVAFATAIFSNLVQTGFLFTLKPITPDFSRIIPRFGQYFRKTLFSAEAAWNLGKSILKVAIIVFISWVNISGEFEKLCNLFLVTLPGGLRLVSDIAVRILLEAAVAMLVLAVPDIIFQRRQYLESLKMTKEEIREEYKMFEGDPAVKGRLREKMRELLGRNIQKTVPEASVVITNPTHYAVAVKWEESAMAAPMVTAKGADEVAFRIRSIATGAGVPVIENKPLARALYAEMDIGDTIPEKYYQSMANVLALVYKMGGRGPGGRPEDAGGTPVGQGALDGPAYGEAENAG